MKRRAHPPEVVFSEVIKNGHLWIDEGVEATLRSSNISKNTERYLLTENMLRKAVTFDRILFLCTASYIMYLSDFCRFLLCICGWERRGERGAGEGEGARERG